MNKTKPFDAYVSLQATLHSHQKYDDTDPNSSVFLFKFKVAFSDAGQMFRARKATTALYRAILVKRGQFLSFGSLNSLCSDS